MKYIKEIDNQNHTWIFRVHDDDSYEMLKENRWKKITMKFKWSGVNYDNKQTILTKEEMFLELL